MKNTLILHGTAGNPKENWFDWLRIELETQNYKVWVPQLPGSDKPNIERYNKFILNNKSWEFNNESILVGHSSGAVEILGLLEALPEDTVVDTCYLVGVFENDLGWDALKGLFTKPFNFETIKKKAKRFILIHSDNDPYIPLEQAKNIRKKLEGIIILLRGQKHFSVSTAGDKYKQFPFLLDLILNN